MIRPPAQIITRSPKSMPATAPQQPVPTATTAKRPEAKRLRATTTRGGRSRSSEAPEEEEYEEREPNMKLSRAIVVMLLLHIVAVGGVFAFSCLKERGPREAAADAPSSPAAPESGEAAEAAGAAAGSRTRPGVYVVRNGETLSRIANDHGITLNALVAANGGPLAPSHPKPGQELRLPEPAASPAADATPNLPPKPAPPSRGQADALRLIEGNHHDSGAETPAGEKTYTVGKGETVYSIAHKLKISYDALLRLNGISDPKKIRIGQKLRLPAKSKT